MLRVSSTNFISSNTNWVRQRFVNHRTVHSLLAASLTVTPSCPNHHFEPWQAVWPSLADLEPYVPLLWPPELQNLLPHRARTYLAEQQARFDRDWEDARPTLPEGSYNKFRHFWLVVNTRCFFWPYNRWPPRTNKSKRGRPPAKLSTADQMALCPVADCFNHSDILNASFEADLTGCRVSVEQDVNAGDELFLRYGTPNNDYLLVEWGFVLSVNLHDNVSIDDAIIPWLDDSKKALLVNYNYFGKYTLSKEGVCHRTQCAVRTILFGYDENKVKLFLSGNDDGTAEQPVVDAWLLGFLKLQLEGLSDFMAGLGRIDDSPQRDVLLKRYQQIQWLFAEVIHSGLHN